MAVLSVVRRGGVGRGWGVGRGRGVGRFRNVVGRLRVMVGWLRGVVGRLGSVVGWARWVVGLLLGVVRCSLVGDLGDISLLVVCGVVDVLGPAVRQSHGVGAGHGAVLVRSLPGVEGSLGVVIIHRVVVGVGLGGFLVVRLWLVVGWGVHLRGVVGGLGWNVGGGWGVVGWSVDHGSVVHNWCFVGGWFVVYRFRFVVDWGRSMVWLRGVVWFRGMVWCWSMVGFRSMVGLRGMIWFRGMVRLRGMVGFRGVVGFRGMVWFRGVVRSRGMVGRRGMVRLGGVVGIRGVVGGVGRSMNTYNRFLYAPIAVHRLGRGGRLAGYMSVVSIVGLVDRHVDCGSIPLFEGLVVGLVRSHHGSTQQPT